MRSNHIVRKTSSSILAVGIRQIFVQGLNFFVSIFLARLLTPSDYSFYILSTFMLNFFVVFSDLGLGPKLIQQDEEPTQKELANVFTAQQILICILFSLIFLFSSYIANLYSKNIDLTYLFRLYAISGLILSFQTISIVKLERNLEFNKIATIEIISNIAYNSSIIILFSKNINIYHFGISLIIRNVISLFLAFILSPWKMEWRFDIKYIKEAIKFGLPYQGINITSILKESFNPIVVGVMLGKTQYGIISWAQMFSTFPIWIIMILQRIYLPLFSRVKNQYDLLYSLTNNLLLFSNSFVAPISIFALFYSEIIVELVFGHKWLIGLPTFYLLWIANLFVPSVVPLTGLMNSFGKSKIILYLSIFWMLGNWVLSWTMIHFFGFIGYGYANAIIQISNIIVFVYAGRLVKIDQWNKILYVWLIALSICLSIRFFFMGPKNLFILLALFGFFYFICLAFYFLIFKDKIIRLYSLMKRKED